MTDAEAHEAVERLLRACRNAWAPDTKRPRWLVCAGCGAIQDPSRGIRPWIWLARHPSLASSEP